MDFLLSIIIILIAVWLCLHIYYNYITRNGSDVKNVFGVIPSYLVKGGEKLF